MSTTKNKIRLYGQMYTEIISKMVHIKYYYYSTSTYVDIIFNDRNISKANKVYWDEILLRAHFTSVTSIMRNEKWLNGIISSIETENFILFSSSLRGFLESVTDSYYSLLNTPFDIASNFKNIELAVKGELDQLLTSDNLEETLIHFQHASKSDQSGRTYNKPLYASNYIKVFDKYGETDTKALYIKLCEIVHPAADSVSCFSRYVSKSDDFQYSTTDSNLDSVHIDNLINQFDDVIMNLLKISLNAPVLSLKVLDQFNYDLVGAGYINSCLINRVISDEAWNKVLGIIEKSFDY